jgi:hypothetical protein
MHRTSEMTLVDDNSCFSGNIRVHNKAVRNMEEGEKVTVFSGMW